ncbi:ankyrin-3-like [Branchiostoma floridae]|uniref:Ankyrin-3-like n=1 Tax=Branchiostoma floridae TaxID=7739 RepID=A0A9J7KJ63_BRAFL|nr:ankyrin-3-like [Branchiostoma floridae]
MAMDKNLWEAVSRNNLQEVQKILSSGRNIDLNEPFVVSIHYRDGFHRHQVGNYLLQACLFSSPIVVSALVKAGANVNKSSEVVCRSVHLVEGYERKYNVTPLILAVIQRNVGLVEKLLHRCGADVNGRNDAGLTALHLTVKPADGFSLFGYKKINSSRMDSSPQCEQIASLLLEAGARVDLQDNMGQTPLHIAVMEKDVVVARMLLRHHARVDVPNREGRTPLHESAKALDAEMCRILTDDTEVDSSTLVNLASNDGTTPLHAAILAMAPQPHMWRAVGADFDNCAAVVTILIRKGANLAAEKDHFTPLHLAAEHGLVNVVKLLVEAGADIRAETPNTGLTPLDMAEHGGNQEIIDNLTARQESDTCEREKNKREEPSIEQEVEEEEPQKSDTPVEDILEGAVGGFEQVLVIKEEGDPIEE